MIVGTAVHRKWLTRIAWFVVLWLIGLGSVSVLAYVLRLWIAPG